MIEILFAESEAGAMKAAKNKVVIGIVNGPASVWMAGKKTTPKRPFAGCGWIEGTAEEVICLGFMLDIGNIREPVDSLYRKKLIYSMYAQSQWGPNQEEVQGELRELGEVYAGELLRLKRFLDDGEAVRIWYSDAPYSICGFYHLCRILREYKNEIRVVKLPEYIMKEKKVRRYGNWGEVSAEEFAGFLSYEKKLSKEEVYLYAAFWSDYLVEDNSPLRTVINGSVLGVPEDFYDFLIWKKLTGQPVKEARLIGDILGSFQIGVGDWWYAKRIDYYIELGKIRITCDSENKYARMLCVN